MLDSDWFITKKVKVSLKVMLDSDWLISKLLKILLLDLMIFSSAWPNGIINILIFLNVKNN